MVVRRLVSFSVLFSASFAYVVLLPLLALGVVLVDGLTDRRFPRVRALALLGGLLAAEVWGLVSAVWILRHRDPTRFVEANYTLQRRWAAGIFRWATWVYGLRFEVGGDPLGDGPFLLLPRHASMADTLLPMWLTAGPPALRPRYALKRELLWDPCLDVVGNRVPNVFIDRKANSGAEIERVATLTEGVDAGSFVVLFPEGTRFSRSRRDTILAKLRERGDAERIAEAESLGHVLPVRPGGTVALLERGGLDVVLLAHAGFEGTRSLRDFVRGHLIGRTIHLELRRVPEADLPTTVEGRVTWLRESWQWMDETVARLQEAR